MALLALLCLLTAVKSQLVPWYATYGLPQGIKDILMEKNCFRGDFGADFALSIFNCLTEGIEAHPFGEFSIHGPVCVVDFKDLDAVYERIRETNTRVLWMGKREIILGSWKSDDLDYPTLCSSRSEFPRGSVGNVIVVPFEPMSKPRATDVPKISAPDPKITSFLNSVSTSQLQANVNSLANNYNTRLSTSAGGNDSAAWIAQQFRNYGFTVTTSNFRSGYCPNVVAVKDGVNDKSSIILVGAHSDSRASSLTNTAERAPGADDNGSGVSMLLEFARVVQSSGIRLHYTLQLATFCGEEQGLYGSQALANSYSSSGVRVIGMYNADMIGYRCGSSIVLTFDSASVTKSLTDTCKNITRTYVTGYTLGDNSGCCSDGQSFYNKGYSTVSFFECPGANVDNPNYHKSTDLPSSLNYEQLTAMSKAVMACSLTQAIPL